jgi:D-lactate dehydrogenase (cytochrome)
MIRPMASRTRARDPRGDPSDLRVTGDPDTVAAHREDAAHVRGGRADAVAWPRSEAAVAALVRASSHVLPIGAQSSVTGGATPTGGLVLSASKLTDVSVSPDQQSVRVGAGVPLSELQATLRQQALWYPPVPTFTGAYAGGVVATNAAGATTFKYGSTRDWVEGLTVVLASGDVVDIRRGDARAGQDRTLEIEGTDGSIARVLVPSYKMPDVPKRSAGYYAEPGMDLVDLFVGSEGTLGVVTGATFRVAQAPPAIALAFVPIMSERTAVEVVTELRDASRATWRDRDTRGIDVAAIEHMDRRSLAILAEDGADRALDISWPPSTDVALLIQLELEPGADTRRVYDEIGRARDPDAPDSPIVRFCRLLDRRGLLDDVELVPPGNRRRFEAFLALREAVPTGVNRRVGAAKRDVDEGIEKTAGDTIVPFSSFGEMLALIREAFERRGLDYAIWGHISDGNIHPNVIPSSLADVIAAREAILELGRAVVRLGGCPLAEHGVGRSALKQALLRDLYGDRGIEEMRTVKRALDPEWKLAPGVLFAI